MEKSINKSIRLPVEFFVGREKETQEALFWLTNDESRYWIISLLGVGGIGKTELAIKIANLLKEANFFNQIVWTTAKKSWLTSEGIISEPIDNFLSFDDVLNQIIFVLNLDLKYTFLPTDEKEVFVRSTIKGFKYLIVIDNLETVEDYRIIKFIENLPAPSKALITSRLGKRSLSNITAQKLEGQKEIRVGPLELPHAINLFKTLSKLSANYLLNSLQNKEVDEIVNRLGRIPLAIEWFVKSVDRKPSIQEILNDLNSAEGDVLKFCFENLINELSPEAIDVLNTLPAFYDFATIEAISFISDLSKEDVFSAINELNSNSLIEINDDNSISILEPTRIYIKALWKSNSSEDEYMISVSEYYLGLIPSLVNKEAFSKISKEHFNVNHIFSWCYENMKFEVVINMARQMSEYLNRIGFWDERVNICTIAISAARNLGKSDIVIEFTYDLAHIYKQRGDLLSAKNNFIKTKEHAERVPDFEMYYLSQIQIAIILSHEHDWDQSDTLLKQSLEFFKENNNIKEVIRILSLLGRNAMEKGDLQLASQILHESVKLRENESLKYDNNEVKLSLAIGYYDLGRFYNLKEEKNNARNEFIKSKKILERLGEIRHLSNLLWYLSVLNYEEGLIDQAKLDLYKVIEIENRLNRQRHLKRAQVLLNKIDLLLPSSNEENNEVDTAHGNTEKKYMISSPNLPNKPSKKIGKIKIFVSYSRDNVEWFEKLKKHLKVLETQNIDIEVWDDTHILPGTRWQDEIHNALDSAHIALLLITNEYLSSSFIINNELPSILKNEEKKD